LRAGCLQFSTIMIGDSVPVTNLGVSPVCSYHIVEMFLHTTGVNWLLVPPRIFRLQTSDFIVIYCDHVGKIDFCNSSLVYCLQFYSRFVSILFTLNIATSLVPDCAAFRERFGCMYIKYFRFGTI
jgi:hypothetical protein